LVCGCAKQLAVKCDILVENYLPGKLTEYGLGYEELRKLNPSLIYTSITGKHVLFVLVSVKTG